MMFSLWNGTSIDGVLTYSDSEYGFSFSARNAEALGERLGSAGVTSIVIDTLQFEVDIESREVLFVWGYFPNVRGTVAAPSPPRSVPGRVVVSPGDRFEPGVSLRAQGAWRRMASFL